METGELDFVVSRLGECRIPSPLSGVRFVSDDEYVLYHSTLGEIEAIQSAGKKPPAFEMAGPRENIYFDTSKLSCGIVTCGDTVLQPGDGAANPVTKTLRTETERRKCSSLCDELYVLRRGRSPLRGSGQPASVLL